MADLPIIFSAPMVRAILREIEQPGTGKTQTRRVINPQPFADGYYDGEVDCTPVPAQASNLAAFFRFGARAVGGDAVRTETWEPRYAIGDRLYVREHWRAWSQYDHKSPRDIPAGVDVQYVADDPLSPWDSRFRQAMHMPRWASRLMLIVTDVRVQQLLDISEEDARAEGFADGPLGDPIPETDIGGGWTLSSPGGYASAAGHFQVYWSKLHPDWDGFSSLWVAAYTFRPILGNIDQVRP